MNNLRHLQREKSGQDLIEYAPMGRIVILGGWREIAISVHHCRIHQDGGVSQLSLGVPVGSRLCRRSDRSRDRSARKN